MHGFSQEMSTGVSYFEQFTWDLNNRGVANIDIPVLILGIDADVLMTPAQELPIGAATTGEILEKTQQPVGPRPRKIRKNPAR
jgi:hypothetical protein